MKKIYIVRSLVATREIGFLPGDHDDKIISLSDTIQNIWLSICSKMPDDASFDMLYGNLKAQDTIDFGVHLLSEETTFDRAIINCR